MGNETGEEFGIWAKLVHIANGEKSVVFTYKPSMCRTTTGETYLTLREKDEESNGKKICTWKEVPCSPDITFEATLQMNYPKSRNSLAILNTICVPSLLGKMAWHTFRVLDKMPDAITKADTTKPCVKVNLVSIAEGES